MAHHHSTTCDRCQREIQPGTGSYVAEPRDVYLQKPRYDLCDMCVEDLKEWLLADDGPTTPLPDPVRHGDHWVAAEGAALPPRSV